MHEAILEAMLTFLKAHPGATPAEIRQAVPELRGRSGDVIHALRVLKLRGAVENRGPRAAGRGPGRWHAVDRPVSRYLERKQRASISAQLDALGAHLEMFD